MHEKYNISDGTATLISDSILVALVQMRGETRTAIARGIVTRVKAITGGGTWSCIVTPCGQDGWDLHCCTNYVTCITDDLAILVFETSGTY